MSDVQGEFTIQAVSPTVTVHVSCGHVMHATAQTGVGINVFAGHYDGVVTYQAATKLLQANVVAGATVLLRPEDLRGTIQLVAPTHVTLPDWVPVTAPAHPYDNQRVTISSGGAVVSQAAVGQSISVPEGAYKLVLNDTVMNINVARQVTTPVYVGRLDVETTDFAGTFAVNAVAPSVTNHVSCAHVMHAVVPLGVGVNVLPGKYTVNIAYGFGGTDVFPVTVPNAPEIP